MSRAEEDDIIQAQQRFWRAEIRDRVVITTKDGYFCETGSKEKTYPTAEAAERGARADYAKMLRLGYLPLPGNELIELMRLVFKIGIRGEGGGTETIDDPAEGATLYACRFQKYWRIQRTDAAVTVSHGDIGAEIESETKTFPDAEKAYWGARAWAYEEEPVAKGWYQSSAKELTAIEEHVRAMNVRLAKASAPAPVDLPAAAPGPAATIVERKSKAATAVEPKQEPPGRIGMSRYEFVEGTSSKFWEIALSGKSFTTTYGRIGAAGASTTKSFASPGEAAKEYEKLIAEKTRKGYALVGGGGATPGAPKAEPKPAGPFAEAYAEAFTSPVVHFIKLSPAKKSSKPEEAPRATSGGRPIMAEGQAWPTCSGCGENQSLFLQFDIEPAMDLGFIPDSHLLVFNCARCDGMAMTVPDKKLPKEWLSPQNPQTYRVILNRPAEREAIFPADPTVLEQRMTFARGDEKARALIEDDDTGEALHPEEPPRGKEGFKVGGIPARNQPWRPPRCHCGAPLGFIFQVPLTGGVGWKASDKDTLGGFLGLDTFIHACTKQCSPYATIVIPDR